ncbi:unnamed protein product [Caenorhabditis bovis]|uniref:Sodium/hydrogen exchanger n=1 Tax=Caenorhabditis bovis TaxID=2654633 RepID=A0A8S1FF63_9PELO|nr:unnamed protein product [Caenorhabditis bovis]
MRYIHFFAIILIAFIVDYVASANGNNRLDMAAQRRAANIHRLDTIILLTYVSVMVLIVLTAWAFKHYRARFIHESGVTLFYGLLVGFVIRYFGLGLLQSQTFDVVTKNRTIVKEPPDYLMLEVKPEGGSKVSFHYELIEGFFADRRKKKEEQIEQKSIFSPEVFFNMLIPPIIFNAGYSLKKRHFFRNIGSILAIVFIGTTISCFGTGCLMFIFTSIFRMGFSFKELLFFGALISATDPVTIISVFNEMNVEADLFALIFGESALNDAVAIVLSEVIENFSTANEAITLEDFGGAIAGFGWVFFGSMLLGFGIGCMNAFLTKMTLISDHPLLESSLFVLISYISFLVAEVNGLTGIVAVLFCGIAQAHYTYNNLSPYSQSSTKHFFHMVSFIMESFIFCYIGVSVFVTNNQKWNFGFFFFAMVSITASRALFVYPLCTILNIQRRPKIPRRHQHMILFAGLRGAMAFALAARNTATENRQIIFATTVAIVIVTVIVNGGLTAWMIDYLQIKHGKDAIEDGHRIECNQSGANVGDEPVTMAPPGSNPWDKAFLPRKWYHFDANFMKPLLTHATPSLEQTLPPFCLPLASLVTSNRQKALGCLATARLITGQVELNSCADTNQLAGLGIAWPYLKFYKTFLFVPLNTLQTCELLLLYPEETYREYFEKKPHYKKMADQLYDDGRDFFENRIKYVGCANYIRKLHGAIQLDTCLNTFDDADMEIIYKETDLNQYKDGKFIAKVCDVAFLKGPQEIQNIDDATDEQHYALYSLYNDGRIITLRVPSMDEYLELQLCLSQGINCQAGEYADPVGWSFRKFFEDRAVTCSIDASQKPHINDFYRLRHNCQDPDLTEQESCRTVRNHVAVQSSNKEHTDAFEYCVSYADVVKDYHSGNNVKERKREYVNPNYEHTYFGEKGSTQDPFSVFSVINDFKKLNDNAVYELAMVIISIDLHYEHGLKKIREYIQKYLPPGTLLEVATLYSKNEFETVAADEDEYIDTRSEGEKRRCDERNKKCHTCEVSKDTSNVEVEIYENKPNRTVNKLCMDEKARLRK